MSSNKTSEMDFLIICYHSRVARFTFTMLLALFINSVFPHLPIKKEFLSCNREMKLVESYLFSNIEGLNLS